MPDPTPVHCNLNTLPPTWDRPGIFVSNLFSVFYGNAGQTADLCAEVGRLESYGGRLMPVMGLMFNADDSNTVVLEEAPDPELLVYFAQALDLRLPDWCLLRHEDYVQFKHTHQLPVAARELVSHLKAKDRGWIDGFVTDDALLGLAGHSNHEPLNTPESSYTGNNKAFLHEHLLASKLPTFDTHLASNPTQVEEALARLLREGYSRAVIKSQVGASGIGLWKCSTQGNSFTVPAYGFHEGPCLVQGWLDEHHDDVTKVRSPSVQLFIHGDAVHLYDFTDQILSHESVHEGNLSPPPWSMDEPDTRSEILRQAECVGRWLHEHGYRGTGSIDFHVAHRRDRNEVRVCEVNARVTGATYPALLARRFNPRGSWLMRNLLFEPPLKPGALLKRLTKHQLLFHAGDTAGVVPINFNVVPGSGVAKGQFLCLAPTLPQTRDLLARLRECLPVADTPTRD